MQIDAAYPRMRLEDSETSLELTRVASRLAGVPLHTCFLDCEIRECMYQWMVHRHERAFKNVANFNRFGLSKKTFRDYRLQLPVLEVAALEGIADETSRGRAAHAIADALPVNHQGRPPYFWPEEVKMQLTMAASLKEAGEGWSTSTVRAMARKCLVDNAVSLSGGDPVKEARLLQAKCSRNWFKQQIQRFGIVKETPVKVGGHSIKRAAATSVKMTNAMMDNYEIHLREHGYSFENPPDDSLVYNCDEVGFDPSGIWARQLAFKWSKEHKVSPKPQPSNPKPETLKPKSYTRSSRRASKRRSGLPSTSRRARTGPSFPQR